MARYSRYIMGIALAGLIAFGGGCAGPNRSTTQPTTSPAVATDIDPETASAAYWLKQGPVVSVQSSSYADLVQECDHVLRQRFFDIDRLDYRAGILNSKPLVSKQFWEFWRSDVGDARQLRASSIATYRRTVYWQINPQDGQFAAVPKVVVERFTAEPKRITSAVSFRTGLSGVEAQTALPSPQLRQAPKDTWYAVGRDRPLELSLAENLRDRMAKHPSGALLQRIEPVEGK